MPKNGTVTRLDLATIVLPELVLIDSDEGRIVIGSQWCGNTCECVGEVATVSNVDGEELRIRAVESIRRLKALRASVAHLSHCDNDAS